MISSVPFTLMPLTEVLLVPLTTMVAVVAAAVLDKTIFVNRLLPLPGMTPKSLLHSV